MRRYLLSLALLLTPSVAQAAPRIADEYIVLRTSAGDVVLALYPDVAPQHVEQLLKLVRLGVYDGTHFHRIEDKFVVQLAGTHERRVPYTPEQKAAIHPIKAEFSTLEHRRGILTMAREDGKPDSALTSFSVIVGPRDRCQHLDGKYTIFGHVVAGLETFDKMVAVPRMVPPDPPVPIVPIELMKAEVVPKDQIRTVPLAMPHDVEISAPTLAVYRNKLQAYVEMLQKQSLSPADKESTRSATGYLISGCVVIIIGLSLTSFLMGTRLSGRMIGTFALLNVLIGGFVLFTLLGPVSGEHETVATGVFFGMAGLFKLMSRFESA